MVYASEIDGTRHTFGVSGKLIMNALVMYDRETDTLWSQFLGRAVEGPLNDTELELIPADITTWGDWKKRHPDTLALDTGFKRPIRDSYTNYYREARAGILGQSNYDDRLQLKELVIGVVGESSQIAYAYAEMLDNPLIHDDFEERPLLLAFNPDGGAVSVFDRTDDEEVFTFEAVEDILLMSDAGTGSIWRKDTGEAIEGPLQGTKLPRVEAITSFWFAWNDFYPNTAVYTPDSAPDPSP